MCRLIKIQPTPISKGGHKTTFVRCMEAWDGRKCGSKGWNEGGKSFSINQEGE
jgi:hypothetical protein